MHHHPRNRERAVNLSILSVSGPAGASRLPQCRWSYSGLRLGRPSAAAKISGLRPGESLKQRSFAAALHIRELIRATERQGLRNHTTFCGHRCLAGGQEARSGLRAEHAPPPARLQWADSVEPLGETGRLGLATDRTAAGWDGESGGRQPPRNARARAWRRACEAGGTVRRSADTECRGRRGPSMASHECCSVRCTFVLCMDRSNLELRPPPGYWNSCEAAHSAPNSARARSAFDCASSLPRSSEPTQRGARPIRRTEDTHRSGQSPQRYCLGDPENQRENLEKRLKMLEKAEKGV
ncbi:uncharacterized protein LOC111611093 [Xiphophorus maculatus]|uniref:uncharacterized protein LOC111611093 n=1 Tax=Xiphophorus maculatus TaxID=8083 RepID=UPI000C6EA929|nr:uncharacterized protein LOC111611093 [Xiphophorus maculatus]